MGNSSADWLGCAAEFTKFCESPEEGLSLISLLGEGPEQILQTEEYLQPGLENEWESVGLGVERRGGG